MIRVNFLDEISVKKDSCLQGFALDLISWLLWLAVAAGLLLYIFILFRIIS